MTEAVVDTFYRFQNDWSNFNTHSMKEYLHPAYLNHMELIMEALTLRQRQNLVDRPELKKIDYIAVLDKYGSENDLFSALITAQADDILLDTSTGKILSSNVGTFIEIWDFVRKKDQWILLNIRQTTEEARVLNKSIRNFSLLNGYYYSPDWGTLLLPTRGQIFRKGSFWRSDINNHVIGRYHSILFEMYTYFESVGLLSRSPQLLVLQATLPKYYGKIVVQRKQKWWWITNKLRKPRGLPELSLEGVDFGKKYKVYAEKPEQVSGFELLDPALMSVLCDLDFEINIEVVDNIIYLYTTDNVSYESMFEVFKWSYNNMKM